MRDIKGKAIVAGVAGAATLAFGIVGVSGVISRPVEQISTVAVSPVITFVSVLAAEYIMDYIKL